jgi:hypothetical protein
LQARYYDPSINLPIYGTGPNFVTTYIQASSTSNLFMSTNQPGVANAPADGLLATGFTFFPVCPASAAGFNITGYLQSATTIFCKASTAGTVTAPTANTSGFTITVYRDPATVAAFLMFNITTIAAVTLAGKYFRFTTLPGPTLYYMWFTVDGIGIDPAPGGTAIKVALKSTYTAADVAAIVQSAISGTQVNVITTIAAGTITPGDYFTFGATNINNYFVWYTVDGIGTIPVVLGSYGIEVDLLSADTAAQVASKTMIAINSTYFAVPNLQGLFLRGYDPTQIWDLGPRFSVNPLGYGNNLGTYEADQLIAHSHVYGTFVPINPGGTGGGSAQAVTSGVTNETGGNENRSVNADVVWLIKY